jgi:hypothetical protein
MIAMQSGCEDVDWVLAASSSDAGIAAHFNERADRLISTFIGPRILTGLLRQHFIEDNSKEAEAPELLKAKHFFLDLADNDMTTMAWLTCAITRPDG